MSVRGTQTEKHTHTAICCESQPRNQVFNREQSMIWRCRNCGYQHEGTTAPDSCPACAHSQAHFEITPSNY